LIGYVSKVSPSPPVFIQTARWQSTREEQLRNPASHRAGVKQVRSAVWTLLFVVSRIGIAHFRSGKIQNQYHKNSGPVSQKFRTSITKIQDQYHKNSGPVSQKFRTQYHKNSGPVSQKFRTSITKIQDQYHKNITPKRMIILEWYNRARITQAVATTHVDMIQKTWDEIADSWDICRHIEQM
jgi:hypothetical protein